MRHDSRTSWRGLAALAVACLMLMGAECVPPAEPVEADAICCEGGGFYWPLGTPKACADAGGTVVGWAHCQSQKMLDALAVMSSSAERPLLRIRVEHLSDGMVLASIEQPMWWDESAPVSVGLMGRQYVGRDGATYIEVDAYGMTVESRRVNTRYLARAIVALRSAMAWADAELAAEVE